MNNRKIILSLYKTKLKICQSQGYKLGNWTYVEPHFSLGKSLVQLRKIKSKRIKATFVMNHIRQAYKDTKHVKDDFLIDAFIDEGFLTLKNFDNFLKLKKKKPNTKNEEDTFIIHV